MKPIKLSGTLRYKQLPNPQMNLPILAGRPDIENETHKRLWDFEIQIVTQSTNELPNPQMNHPILAERPDIELI